jgi:hypothetical protein
LGLLGRLPEEERSSSPLRGKEQLGLAAWHFTTLCIEAGFPARKDWRPELRAPTLTRNGRNRSMSAQAPVLGRYGEADQAIPVGAGGSHEGRARVSRQDGRVQDLSRRAARPPREVSFVLP